MIKQLKSNPKNRQARKIAEWIFWAMIGIGFVYIALSRQSVPEVNLKEMVFLALVDLLMVWRCRKLIYESRMVQFPYDETIHFKR